MNLSKIGGEKLIEIEVNTEKKISSRLWEKDNNIVFLEHNSNYDFNLYIAKKDGSIVKNMHLPVTEFGEIDVATFNNEIYLLMREKYGTKADLYKLDKNYYKTKIGTIQKEGSNGYVRFRGIKDGEFYITSYNEHYRTSDIYKYNINSNTATRLLRMDNEVYFMYLLNGIFYFKCGSSLYLMKVKDNTVTKLCDNISGYVHVINNEIYQFNSQDRGNFDGISYTRYDVSKFDFSEKKFKFIKQALLKSDNSSEIYTFAPKMDYFMYASANGNITRYVKELYLTEKREE